MNQRDCKKCVYYGGKRKGKVFCLNDKCVREKDRNRRKGNRYGSKINREIRNYTESMFFGLSLRQFIFLFSLVALQ